MYNEKILSEFKDPQNMGEIPNANAIGTVGNAKCGDILQIFMRIEDNIIKDVGFKTFGCVAAIASSSIATQMIKGKSIDEVLAITNAEVVAELEGLPPQKIHCSVLAEEAIKNAIENYKNNLPIK